MTPTAGARWGIEARWLTSGPPSGRGYVRHLIMELAAAYDREDYVAFVRGVPESGSAAALRPIVIPSLPALLFNTLAIPARLPRTVEAVAYQNFTPVISGARAVTVIHDLIFMTNPRQFSVVERSYLGFISRLLPRATVVAAVSDHVRSEVLAQWPARDPASVVVAPNGVDSALLEAARLPPDPVRDADTLARHRIARPYVLYLGRINVRKNLGGLIRSFAAARLPDHELVIAGPADGLGVDIEGQANDLGVARRVKRLGAVPAADLPALFRHADLFAYLSFDEGFGVPPLEAMAFGVPVVCSDIAALRETAGPGGAVMVSPHDVEQMADGLERAAGNSTVREDARLLGPQQAAKYRWSDTAIAIQRALELAAA